MQARAISSSRSLIRLLDQNVRATTSRLVDFKLGDHRKLSSFQQPLSKSANSNSDQLMNLSAITNTNLMTKMGFHSSPFLNGKWTSVRQIEGLK